MWNFIYVFILKFMHRKVAGGEYICIKHLNIDGSWSKRFYLRFFMSEEDKFISKFLSWKISSKHHSVWIFRFTFPPFPGPADSNF